MGWGGRKERKIRQEVIDEGEVCLLCFEPVDKTIPSPHPMSPSVDHVIPRSRGGSDEKSNLRLTHRGCNMKRGAPKQVPRNLGSIGKKLRRGSLS